MNKVSTTNLSDLNEEPFLLFLQANDRMFIQQNSEVSRRKKRRKARKSMLGDRERKGYLVVWWDLSSEAKCWKHFVTAG